MPDRRRQLLQVSNWFLVINYDQITPHSSVARFSLVVCVRRRLLDLTQCTVRRRLSDKSFCTAVRHLRWPRTRFKRHIDPVGVKCHSAQKQRWVFFVCTLNSGAAATVFWAVDGTRGDEKMIWFGFYALQNQVIIRTSNTAKSVFCMTKKKKVYKEKYSCSDKEKTCTWK